MFFVTTFLNQWRFWQMLLPFVCFIMGDVISIVSCIYAIAFM